MTRTKDQDIVLRNIKDNLKSHPSYYITGQEPFLAISSFHYIETVPDTTPMDMAHGLFARLEEDLAIAFRADGIYCLYISFPGPTLLIASTLDHLRDIASGSDDPEARELMSESINLMEKNPAMAA